MSTDEIPEHILAHDDRCDAVTGGGCNCREWERFDEDRRAPDDDGDRCECSASEEDGHTEDGHTSCGMSMRSGEACGGCHDCISAQDYYWRRRREAVK